ncbi:hypothetical protein DER45DRAFT_644545 [Fusarium avenaceum]|nr:hypothetical protein DER45DRAFT_644545 [Fusarium avenaceum]
MSLSIQNPTQLSVQPQIPVNSTTLRENAHMVHIDSDRRSAKIDHAFDWRACFSVWRKLWLYLAQSQQQMGVNLITDNAIEQMKNNLDITDSDLQWALRKGSAEPLETIMNQTFLFGRATGRWTAGRINYAVPAEFVTRNCHSMLVREALDIFIPRIPEIMSRLREFAVSNKSRRAVFHPCRQFTQISTFGRRAADWALDLGRDLMVLEKIRDDILLCGTQGTKDEMTHLTRVVGGDVRSCEQLDIMLCQYAGFKGCYDAEKISTEKYERDLTLAIGGALANLALGISRTLTEMAFFKTEQKYLGSTSTITDLICRTNHHALRIAADWTRCLSPGFAIGPVVLQKMFTNVDTIIRRFESLIVEIDTSSIKPLVDEALPGIVTRKITERMVQAGRPRDLVIWYLSKFACQTLLEHDNIASTKSFFDVIKRTEYFKPVWWRIDYWSRDELNIRGCERTVDEVCARGGSLDMLLEEYKASVEKVKSYKMPDEDNEELVESSSSGSDADDEDSFTTTIRWTVQGENAPATSGYQSDSGKTKS